MKVKTNEGAAAIIPEPARLRLDDGRFTIENDTSIFYSAGAESVARYARDLLAPPTGFDLPAEMATAGAPAKGIVLYIDAGSDFGPDGGYRLDATTSGIKISANQPAGIFYGIQSLRQLLPVEIEHREHVAGGDWSVPCCEIKDHPRFQWRGFMLDTSRHFFPLDEVKRVLGIMALLKMNVFHWGLTNDQGWRFDVKKYPRLIEIGSKRKASQIKGFFSKETDGIPHEGYYSQDEARDVVKLAGSLFINVVPEVNMPGHCRAALASYPELSCKEHPFEVAVYFGIKKDVYCVGKDTLFTFLEGVLDEVMDVFPSPVIHIGGDEVKKDRWKECPRCQARITHEGLKNEEELQVCFTNRMVANIKSKGRRAMGWNEVLQDSVDRGVIGQYWLRHPENVKNHLSNGGNVVMSHFFHSYLDYNHGVVKMKRVYGYDPCMKGFDAISMENVLGIEAPFWSEFSKDANHAYQFIFPRLLAVAENGWTVSARKNYDAFITKLPQVLQRVRALGANHASIEAATPGLLKRIWLLTRVYKQSWDLPR